MQLLSLICAKNWLFGHVTFYDKVGHHYFRWYDITTNLYPGNLLIQCFFINNENHNVAY